MPKNMPKITVFRFLKLLNHKFQFSCLLGGGFLVSLSVGNITLTEKTRSNALDLFHKFGALPLIRKDICFAMRKMNIAVAGLGYVGTANALMAARHNMVTAVDLLPQKAALLNEGRLPVADALAEEYIRTHELDLRAVTDGTECYSSADYVIIATPTDLVDDRLDTSSVESVIKQVVSVNPRALIVVRSTVPIGFTNYAYNKYKTENILFCPEFLREGRALCDELNPSRIIVGFPQGSEIAEKEAHKFAELLLQGAEKKDAPVMVMNSTEAEAVKLFANTYLAMRIAYFNELDAFAESSGLNARNIIDGVCGDERIGNYYNNPSFGYGGYCLPKDTKQLLGEFDDLPNDVIGAVVKANASRTEYIARQILEKAGKHNKEAPIGIYRLTMKSNSDNLRNSSSLEIIKALQRKGASVIVYEPSVKDEAVFGCPVIRNLDDFKEQSAVIAANRYHRELDDVLYKVYMRDAYFRN